LSAPQEQEWRLKFVSGAQPLREWKSWKCVCTQAHETGRLSGSGAVKEDFGGV